MGYNVREHPRYEEIKRMFNEAVKRHPETKIITENIAGLTPSFLFFSYFETDWLYVELVRRRMLKEFKNGIYKHLMEIKIQKDISLEEQAFLHASVIGGSDIVLGVIIKVFDDTNTICRGVDRNYLIKVDSVLFGPLKKGDTIQVKFYGNVRWQRIGGYSPDYNFMCGDTILAQLHALTLIYDCPSLLEPHKFDIGYRMPFFLTPGIYGISTIEVKYNEEDEKIISKVPKYITGPNGVKIPYDILMKYLKRKIELTKYYQDKWFKEINDEIMDSIICDDSLTAYGQINTNIIYKVIKEE